VLDSIALTLDRHQFEIREPGRFSPSARGLLTPPYYHLGGRGHFACVQNPTKNDLKTGRYLPRLTLQKRLVRGGFSVVLRIEFSAPKMIFGNNFDELTSRDFERVLDALGARLAGMGVDVDDYTLRAARVSAIHYGKNVALLDYTSAAMALNELSAIDLNRRLDLSRTDYRNEGHAIRYHANSFEVTFYDKLADLRAARVSEKRAIERDSAIQAGLFLGASPFPNDLEVLRMEVRLGTRAKILNVLKRIGADPGSEPTFAALFDVSLAKSVLLHFLDGIQSQALVGAGSRSERPEELLDRLAREARGAARPGYLLQQVGFTVLVGSVGLRGLGALMGRHCSARSWQRYKRQMAAAGMGRTEGSGALAQVNAALRQFRPLRLADFKTSRPEVE
jgi:hypothetical protein